MNFLIPKSLHNFIFTVFPAFVTDSTIFLKFMFIFSSRLFFILYKYIILFSGYLVCNVFKGSTEVKVIVL